MTDLTLWMGTVGHAPFAERVAAAAACGYTGLSVLPTDCAIVPRDRMRALADDAGIRLVSLDPIVGWLPGWRPVHPLERERLEFLHALAMAGVEEMLETASALGCSAVTLIEPYGRRVPVDVGAKAFAAVCDRAAEHGLVVQLEAMPFSGIPDLATAWSIVRGAGRDNGGLVLDTWHFFRSGGNLALLETLPVERMSVQLCDAPSVPDADLYLEALNSRLLPGEGDLDLAAVMNVLRAHGFIGPIGPEVVSSQMRALTAVDAAQRAAEACRQLLDGGQAETRWASPSRSG